MTLARTVAWVTLVLSVIWYRSGGLIKNCILIKSPLPAGYIASGDYASQCSTLRDPSDAVAESLSSCEDATFWELHDTTGNVVERPVIVTCDPLRKTWNTVMGPMRNPDPRGGLWLFVPPINNAAGAAGKTKHAARILGGGVAANKAHRITIKDYPANHDFHPLGVEIWPSHAGNASNLYVINHARERTVIEQFVMNPARPTEAVHVRTLSSPYFLSPNGLALTSPDSFYVSNDHLITRRVPVVGHVLPVLESVLALPLGYVSHISLNKPTSKTALGATDAIAKHTFAKLFVPFPNGVSISSSGTEVAIVSTSLSEVIFFERDPATNELTRRKHSVPVPFSPDNIHYTPSMDGSGREEVILAGHPNFPDLVGVAANKKAASAGSWVISIVPKDGPDAKAESAFDLEAAVSTNTKMSKDGANWTLKTLFQSHGIEDQGGFAASTTGLRDPDTGAIYVAGLYARGGLLVCNPGSEKK
ncbi:arylesterase [Crassisporium funariophilum]|nr:arylesterase [Crassisporium funariophilum]